MSEKKVFKKELPFTREQFFAQYQRLTANEPYHVLLESGRGGRYSIAGMKPFARVAAREDGIEVATKDNSEYIDGKPLRALEKWMKRHSMPIDENMTGFQGGAIGYISYDYTLYLESLPNKAQDDIGLPILYFLVFHEWAIFDHEKQSLALSIIEDVAAEQQVLEKLEALAKEWSTPAEPEDEQLLTKTGSSELEVSLSEAEYMEAVEKIQAYIADGDTYQVNLSVRQSQPLHVPALQIYKELRKLNPSPYMGYIHTPAFQVVCGSPELLVKKEGEKVSTRPIAGTRPRGQNDVEDAALAKDLIENEKERAEHVMVVDLERNDLGRVCAYGSVEVNELMAIEKYSHVMHIVSNVRGELAAGKNSYDLIEAMFPGGTITGAPKIRTMEIIEELEPVKRGLYTGSIGWIGFNEDVQLNIVIRTLIAKEGKGYVQAGAGVVIDSHPRNEYRESLKKAEALWRAKEKAEGRGKTYDSANR